MVDKHRKAARHLTIYANSLNVRGITYGISTVWKNALPGCPSVKYDFAEDGLSGILWRVEVLDAVRGGYAPVFRIL